MFVKLFLFYSTEFYTRTSTSTITKSYLTRAPAAVRFMRANNVYIILFAPLTDADSFFFYANFPFKIRVLLHLQ